MLSVRSKLPSHCTNTLFRYNRCGVIPIKQSQLTIKCNFHTTTTQLALTSPQQSSILSTYTQSRDQHTHNYTYSLAVLTATGITLLFMVYDDKQATNAADNIININKIVPATNQPSDVLSHNLSQLSSAGDITLAPLYKRILAGFMDSLIIAGISNVITIIFGPSTALIIAPFLSNVGYDICNNVYLNGQTIGKLMCSIQTIRNNGLSVDFITACKLYTGKLFNIILGLDIIVALFNNENKCIHNYLSDTVVVNSNTNLNTLLRNAFQ